MCGSDSSGFVLVQARVRSDRPHATTQRGWAQVMFSRLTRGKHSLLARSSATVCECPNQKPVSPKHPILILLCKPSSKPSGMILLQIASADSREGNVLNRPNYLRIFNLEDKCVRGIACAKSHRMISLQDSKNNRPGMILLQKKVGGGGYRRTSRAKLPQGTAAATPTDDGTLRLI
jgi:hypothetical protein